MGQECSLLIYLRKNTKAVAKSWERGLLPGVTAICSLSRVASRSGVGLVALWSPCFYSQTTKTDLQRLVDGPLLKLAPKKGQSPDVLSPRLVRVFLARLSTLDLTEALDCQVLSLVNEILGRIE